MLTQQHWFEICPNCNTEFRFYIVAPPMERLRAVVTFQKAYNTHHDACKKARGAHKNRIKQFLNEKNEE